MLNNKGFFTQGYAYDGLTILVQEAFLEILQELTQAALEVAEEWCREVGLSVNPLKSSLVVFTRKHKVGRVEELILGRTRLVPVESVKYLEVTLDKKLCPGRNILTVVVEAFASTSGCAGGPLARHGAETKYYLLDLHGNISAQATVCICSMVT